MKTLTSLINMNKLRKISAFYDFCCKNDRNIQTGKGKICHMI